MRWRKIKGTSIASLGCYIINSAFFTLKRDIIYGAFVNSAVEKAEDTVTQYFIAGEVTHIHTTKLVSAFNQWGLTYYSTTDNRVLRVTYHTGTNQSLALLQHCIQFQMLQVKQRSPCKL